MGLVPRHFFRLSVRPQHFRGAKFVESVIPKNSFLFIQTLPYDCSHIEGVHLQYCARFIIFFLILTGVELRHFYI